MLCTSCQNEATKDIETPLIAELTKEVNVDVQNFNNLKNAFDKSTEPMFLYAIITRRSLTELLDRKDIIGVKFYNVLKDNVKTVAAIGVKTNGEEDYSMIEVSTNICSTKNGKLSATPVEVENIEKYNMSSISEHNYRYFPKESFINNIKENTGFEGVKIYPIIRDSKKTLSYGFFGGLNLRGFWPCPPQHNCP